MILPASLLAATLLRAPAKAGAQLHAPAGPLLSQEHKIALEGVR